jgi:hypothetical protein
MLPFESNEMIKNRILKNLKDERPMVAKTDKAHSLIPKINNLIEQIELCDDLPLETMIELKELCRQVDLENKKALDEGRLSPEEYEDLKRHNLEISKCVDELMKRKLSELNNRIAIRAKQLEKDGHKLGLTLKDQPQVFIKDLDISKYTEDELGMIDRDLRLLNSDIYDAVKYLQAGVEQKAKDLAHHVDPKIYNLKA